MFQLRRESAQVGNLSLSVVLRIGFKILYKRSVFAEFSEIIEERFNLGNPLNDLLGLGNLRVKKSLYSFAVH
jgi:hypothetical protein